MSKTGEVITDQGKQLESWLELYLELYTTKNVVSVATLNALPNLTVMEELDVLSTEEELSKAIYCLSCGKGLPFTRTCKIRSFSMVEHLRPSL
jgi:hypothetical protein